LYDTGRIEPTLHESLGLDLISVVVVSSHTGYRERISIRVTPISLHRFPAIVNRFQEILSP
jgi:hypothetical protein